MGKHLDKLGDFESFTAPWEAESGEVEVNKPTLKRLLFNLKKGEATALDSVDESKEAIKAAEDARDEAKAEAAKASPDEANKKIERLEKGNASLKDKVSSFEKANEQRELRAEVLGDLPEKYSKYVVGETKEELEKSLEQVRKDFGLGEPGEDDDDDDENVLQSRPKSRLRNYADPNGGADGEKEIDFDAVADSIVGAGRVFG